MRKFFKSDWFKCITVLLLLSAVLGGLLAFLSDLLFVSPSERSLRAIKKIYGEEKEYLTIIDVDGENANAPIEYSFGQINKIYLVGDDQSASYDLLFQTTGYQGYKNGTITVWVKVSAVNGIYSIDKVILESYAKQTLMSKLDGKYFGAFTLSDVTEAYKSGQNFVTEQGKPLSNPVSGATYSATAGNNAVNCVIKYLGELN